MITAAVNSGDYPSPNELIKINFNEQSPVSNTRKRSAQQTIEYDLTNDSPKRNKMEISDGVAGNVKQPSKLGQNKQETTRISTATKTASSSYFKTSRPFNKRTNDSSTRPARESPRQTFPPFRITLHDTNRYPTTELSMIKEINKHCKLSLTYGRYTKTADDQTCFLLYASTTTQFEHLMCESNWPLTINNTKYKFDLPNKIPSSYSIVVQNVPSQWDAEAFGDELKQHYPSIVRTVRLFVNGGRPLSKVRVDFSSYKDLSIILKSKRILLDDDNTAFTVEPYLPPTRILRCYNCQVYDDHIAAHCPNKNNPVCFRCALQHPYNPNCDNPIKCVHCQGEHMAGNPSCPVKLEKRQEKNQRTKISNETSAATTQQQHKQSWNGKTKEHLFGAEITTNNATPSIVNNNNYQTDIVNMFEKINNTMLLIKQQQDDLKNKFDSIDMKFKSYNNDIIQMKYCIYEILCPLVEKIANPIESKTRGSYKETIQPLYIKLVDFISKNTITNISMDDASEDNTSAEERKTSNRNLYQTITHES
ncbi:unnamed protein product [Adineta steineri]|uniref:Gag-like protein n=1 Tax=Adineta steineri TaxID=433720 RepID=A0A813SQ16_9BILA|nr:unnamed protein product [Adineta steineri]CAF4059155.1 unnamed protein product [Adineta steineri]